MSETRVDLYEGLFLLTQSATADLNAGLDFVRQLLERAKAEVVVLTKWDDRKLAYTIKGQKRGTYILSYFRAPRANLIGLERDCNLSENVLRAMFLRADHIGEVELEQARQGEIVAKTEVRLREGVRPAGDAIEGEEVPANINE